MSCTDEPSVSTSRASNLHGLLFLRCSRLGQETEGAAGCHRTLLRACPTESWNHARSAMAAAQPEWRRMRKVASGSTSRWTGRGISSSSRSSRVVMRDCLPMCLAAASAGRRHVVLKALAVTLFCPGAAESNGRILPGDTLAAVDGECEKLNGTCAVCVSVHFAIASRATITLTLLFGCTRCKRVWHEYAEYTESLAGPCGDGSGAGLSQGEHAGFGQSDDRTCENGSHRQIGVQER
jgi:hypothetical protein